MIEFETDRAPLRIELDEYIERGLISKQSHPIFPLTLYNYTNECAFQRAWDDVTTQSRGLILHSHGDKLIARPFRKFFNLGEMPVSSPENFPDPWLIGYQAEEKIDGSLGIWWNWEGDWYCSTRGSFTSEQAEWAQDFGRRRYNFDEIPKNVTILTEIIYPENRIVVDYKDRKELVLLGVIHTRSGLEVSQSVLKRYARRLGMRLPELYDIHDLTNPTFRENHEGYVVRWDNGLRVKIKSPDYVEMHRLVDEVTFKRLLGALRTRHLDEGISPAGDLQTLVQELREGLPDHRVDEFDDLIGQLNLAFWEIRELVDSLWRDLLHLKGNRKAFALAVQDRAPAEVRGMLFSMFDQKDTTEQIYKAIANRLKERGKPCREASR